MKERLSMIWLALLTVYLTCMVTDMYTTLRSVESCQANTLRFMQKSAKILKRLKTTHQLEEEVEPSLGMDPAESQQLAAAER